MPSPQPAPPAAIDPPTASPAPSAGGRIVLARRACVAAGTLLSALMAMRGQVGGDQLNLLARGWLLATQGRFISFGNPMSTGGKAPGGTTSLLVGLPLLLWRDHRAATLVVLLFHLLGFFVLDRSLRGILRPHERLLLAVFYWLNPWRLYFSGFLWNPNYLYPFAAAHLATALAQRHRARFWPSFLHAACLLLALQIHASALVLAAASVLLWARGYFKLHWPAAGLGFLAANLPLLPWYRDVLTHPALIAEAHKGFLGRGLVLVFPLLRGLLYWLRYSSLSLAGRMGVFDFREAFGAAADRWLQPIYFALTQVIAPATVLVALLANLWLVRRKGGRLRRRLPDAASVRTWLQGYVLWTLAATVLVLCLAPTTFMYWQGLVLVHAAALPAVLWLGALWRRRRTLVPAAVAVYAALEIAVGLGMAFGSPDYRCRGEETVVFPLRYHSPMFSELGIQATCPWPLDVPDGWWPDVLPGPDGAIEGLDGAPPAH
jgi:hypothetical protein